MTPTVEDNLALRELADRYALAVDTKDAKGLTALFWPEGIIVNYSATDPGTEVSRLEGHDAIAGIRQRMIDRYDRTFHLVSSAVYEVDGDTASGDTATGHVYCTAHHVRRKPEGITDRVMFIHYEDRYARRDGQWRFAERRLRVQWVEYRALGERTELGPPDTGIPGGA